MLLLFIVIIFMQIEELSPTYRYVVYVGPFLLTQSLHNCIMFTYRNKVDLVCL